MEFLDTALIKDSSLFEENLLFSGFKNPFKKTAKQKNLSLYMNSIL